MSGHQHCRRKEIKEGEWLIKEKYFRCYVYNTILHPSIVNVNYAIHVQCLECSACEAWNSTLSLYNRCLALGIKICKEELQSGKITINQLRGTVDNYLYEGVETSFQEVMNRMIKKGLGTIEK